MMSDDETSYERRCAAAEERLRPLVTPEFLSTLVQAAKTCGWSLDYSEVRSFVEWCYGIADIPEADLPDLKPFVYDVEDDAPNTPTSPAAADPPPGPGA